MLYPDQMYEGHDYIEPDWDLVAEQLAEDGFDAEAMEADLEANRVWDKQFPHLRGMLGAYENLVWGMEIVGLRPHSVNTLFEELPF